METSGNFGKLSRYPRGANFVELLRWHMAEGTRPEGVPDEQGEPWNNQSLSVAMDAAKTTTNGGVDPDTIDGWLREGNRPYPKNFALLTKVIFHDNLVYKGWKIDFQAAYEKLPKQRNAVNKNLPADVHSAGQSYSENCGIPRLTPYFTGRDNERDRLVRSLLSKGIAPAILVEGGPGIGKTELTKAVGHHAKVVERFGNRRWFIPLENSKNAIMVQHAIMRAIGFDTNADFHTAVHSLRGKQSLFILDNLETPWENPTDQEATEAVLAELSEVAGLHLLASFRGHNLVDNRSLRAQLDGISDKATEDLFASIAGEWVRADRNLADFVRELAGMPLAIDLVARRAKAHNALSPLWSEWNKQGTNFAKVRGQANSRLTSLSHSIKMSLDSPRVTEQDDALRLFGILGCLPAGLSQSDIDILIGENSYDAFECLLQAGLILHQSGTIDLLPPIRNYAAHQHCPNSVDKDHLTRYLISKMDIMRFEGVSEDEYRRNVVNIESAIRKKMKSEEPCEILELINILEDFSKIISFQQWFVTSVFEEFLNIFRDRMTDRDEAWWGFVMSSYLENRCEYLSALEIISNSIEIFTRIDDLRGEAESVFKQGTCYFQLSKPQNVGEKWPVSAEYARSAEDAFIRSRSIFSSIRDSYGEASCTEYLDLILSFSDARNKSIFPLWQNN